MEARAYRLIKAKTSQVEGTVICQPPRVDSLRSKDWSKLISEVDALRLGYIWSGGVFDLEDPGKIWLVDEYGYMSHYLEAVDKAAVIKKPADGNCPKCGEAGQFVRMALVCSHHGAYAGL
jgi:hypothetical protein